MNHKDAIRAAAAAWGDVYLPWTRNAMVVHPDQAEAIKAIAVASGVRAYLEARADNPNPSICTHDIDETCEFVGARVLLADFGEES